MRYLLLALTVLVQPAVAMESVSVRAMEHPSHSRLVLPLDAETSWTLIEDGRDVTLSLTDGNREFDTSDIFNRIPRTRILSAKDVSSVGRPRLQLTLGCECEVVARRIGSGFLAVDVLQRVEEGGTAGARRLRTSPVTVTSSLEWVDEPQVAQADAANDIESEPDLPLPDIPDDATSMELLAPLDDTDIAIAQAREALLEQLASAAEDGLLELAPAQSLNRPLEASLTTPSKSLYEADVDDLVTAGEADVFANAQVSTRSPLDRRSAQTDAPKQAEACVSDNRFDVADWSRTGEPRTEVAEMRRALISSRGKAEPRAAVALARYYVSLGLGAEARAVLEAFDQHGPEAVVVAELALLVDGLPVPDDATFRSAASCSDAAAFWTALSSTDGTIEAEAALSGLKRLPPSLRKLLGPRLATVFSVSGDENGVEATLAVIDRTPDADVPATMLIEATRDAQNPARAGQSALSLNRLRSSNSPEADLALATYVATQLANAEPIESGAIEDLAISARQNEATSTGREALMLKARALAATGDLPRALAVIEDIRLQYPESHAETVVAGRKLLNEADPTSVGESAFVASVLASDLWRGDDTEAFRLRLQLSEQMIGIGLPNTALTMLNDGIVNAAVRRMRGQALLQMRGFDAALSEIDGLQDTAANSLRDDIERALSRSRAAYLPTVDRMDASNVLSGFSGQFLEDTEKGLDAHEASFVRYARALRNTDAVFVDEAVNAGDVAGRLQRATLSDGQSEPAVGDVARSVGSALSLEQSRDLLQISSELRGLAKRATDTSAN